MHLKYVQQKYAGVHELSKCQYPNGPTEHAKNKASLHHSLDTDYYYRSLCHIRTIVSPPYILIQKTYKWILSINMLHDPPKNGVITSEKEGDSIDLGMALGMQWD